MGDPVGTITVLKRTLTMVVAAVLIQVTFPLAGAEGAALSAIRLTPRSGPPTTQIRINGWGFGPLEVVDVIFDDAIISRALTNGMGRFAATVAVPATAVPGDHAVTGTGETSGLTATTRFVVQTDWAQFHFSPDLVGVNPYENVLSPSNVSGLSERWTSVLPASVEASPAVVDGMIYTGTGGGNVYGIDAATGAVRWHHSTNAVGVGDPAVAGGTAYFGTLYDHTLHAYSSKTGKPLWNFRADAGLVSPTVSGDLVYIGDDLTSLYAVDAKSGDLVWKATVSGGIGSAPAVADGRVYVGTYNFSVYAFDARTGVAIWTTTIGAGVQGSPAVSEGVVYIGSFDDQLYALDAATGDILWTFATGADIQSSPAVANGTVYVGSNDHNVYAVNASSGVLIWMARTGDIIQRGSPAVANGIVFVGSEDSSIYAFDALTGATLWSYRTGDLIVASPAIVDGVLYVGSFDRRLYAFQLP